MFCFIRSGSGRVRYILDMGKSGLSSPKKVGFGSGTGKFGYPFRHYAWYVRSNKKAEELFLVLQSYGMM